jgi:hypothetical protein
MSKDFLAGRERALEDEFFYRVDQKLREQLRAKMQTEQDCKQLSAETGIRDETVLKELVDVGITTDTMLALSLVPLVQVAWADRIVQEKEREAILKAAAEQGRGIGSASFQMLEHWLESPPEEKVMQAWKDYVGDLCKTLDSARVAALRDDVISHAREVAEAAGGLLGLGAVSEKEQAVLEELEQAFAAGSTE